MGTVPTGPRSLQDVTDSDRNCYTALSRYTTSLYRAHSQALRDLETRRRMDGDDAAFGRGTHIYIPGHLEVHSSRSTLDAAFGRGTHIYIPGR